MKLVYSNATLFFCRSVYYFLSIILASSIVNAQDLGNVTSDTACVQKDLGDVLRASMNKPPKVDTTAGGSILLVPIIGSNPATGFMIGVGGQYAFKLPGADTRYSMLSGSVQFTTKNQQLFLLKNNIYTKNNNIFFHR
jgi:hypothetical protein